MEVKPLILAGAFLACATSAEAADAWTCTYGPILDDRVQLSVLIVRFEIAIPDLIQTSVTPKGMLLSTPPGTHYRILQNNDYGLVATYSVSGIVEGAKDPLVGATSIVINKTTSEWHWVEAITSDKFFLNQTHNGTCLHD